MGTSTARFPRRRRTDAARAFLRIFHRLEEQRRLGTQFDLKVELLKNGTAVASGLERCITGVTRNPLKATEAVVPFDAFPQVFFTTGDTLALRVSTRVGTNADDTKCSGPGGSHNNAVGLRLYYDSASRDSRFDATISPEPNEDLFLHSDGNPCNNAPSSASRRGFWTERAGRRQREMQGFRQHQLRERKPFSEIGTWARHPAVAGCLLITPTASRDRRSMRQSCRIRVQTRDRHY